MVPTKYLGLIFLMLMMVTLTAGNPTSLINRWYELMSAQKEDTVDSTLMFQAVNVELGRTWLEFKQTYAKEYETTDEEQKRLDIFRSNLDIINEHNALYAKGFKSYTLGVNQFADLTLKEFVATLSDFQAVKKPTPTGRSTYFSPANDFVTLTLADSVDWRTKGYVTPVKDQGQCGSCWAFSTTGSMEGQHFKKTGQLVSLSEQNLVDCSGPWGNEGCNGGLMDNAFQYVIDNHGIDTEASYPYTAVDTGSCKFSAANVGATISSYKDVPTEDEKALKEAVATVGPVSVAIDASHSSFQLYSSGLYDEPQCSTQQLDHGVLAVGYGQTGGADSWTVKNSWNTSWGDKGYIYMSRNKNNQCGIATKASYPVV